ncbi:hypothetical protein V3391_03785 [Luteimonas sp. SMYT11W]|uniref:RiboL-PSP-HEPN domain-containing protein n=1 Tax=Luteimonas flava TaxID=3115822 RepID=A0ABU7WBK7_9GAMM
MKENELTLQILDAATAKAVRDRARDRAAPAYPTSAALEEFQRVVHRYVTCLAFVVKGFALISESLPDAKSPTQNIFVGNGPPGEGDALSRIRVEEAHDYLAKDGFFTDAITKSLIVRIYAEWDEKYRAAIGLECGVSVGGVSSDLMGDLRHIRNWIVHKKSIAPPNFRSFAVLQWRVTAGEFFAVTRGDFEDLIIEINRMVVSIGDRID